MTLAELQNLSPYDDHYPEYLARLFAGEIAHSVPTNTGQDSGAAAYWAGLLGGTLPGSNPGTGGGGTTPTNPTGGGAPPTTPTPPTPPAPRPPAPTAAQVAANPSAFAGTSFDPSLSAQFSGPGFGGGANTLTQFNNFIPYTQNNPALVGRNTIPDSSASIAAQNALFAAFPEVQYLAFGSANPNSGRSSMASLFNNSTTRDWFRRTYGRDIDPRFNNPLFDTNLNAMNPQLHSQIMAALDAIDPRLGRAYGPSMDSASPGTATSPMGVSNPSGGGATPPGNIENRPGGAGNAPVPPGGTGAVDPLANLPALDEQRTRYLAAIDAFIRSQNPYATITDDLRRQFNLPTQVELQMNQRANPRANPANFFNNTAPNSAPFIPGSAPPPGMRWAWTDPDGAQGPHPGNYGLVPSQNFFNELPGSHLEDLQSLVSTLNDPRYANKLLPSRSLLAGQNMLGDIGNFITTDQSGRNYSLAPQESINMLLPFIQNQDLYSYFQDILGTAAPKLGRSFSAAANDPRKFIFDNINNTSLLSDFFNRTNTQLRRDRLPTIQDLLAGSTGSQIGNENFANAPLDFYRPNTPPPAFFQYLLNDPDGAGGAPERYMLTPNRNPMMRSEAEQMLATLNNRDLPFGLALPNSLSAIFSSQLNAQNQPVYAINSAYRFPQQDPAGGPTSGSGLPSNTNSGPMVGADPNSYQRGLLEERSGTNPQASDSMVSLYGTGFGTSNLGQTPAPGTGGGTTPPAGGSPTTPTSGAGNPFAGITPPATTSSRPPAFYTPWSYWT